MNLNFNSNKVSIITEKGKVFKLSQEFLLKFRNSNYQIQVSKEAINTIVRNLGEKVLSKYQNKLIHKHTGISAKVAKEMAKEIGAPSKDRTSGRQAIRFLEPAIGSAMAYADYLIICGSDIEEAIALSKKMVSVFEEIIDIEKNNNNFAA